MSSLPPLSPEQIARHRAQGFLVVQLLGPRRVPCDPHVKIIREAKRPVLEDLHSWMIAGEA